MTRVSLALRDLQTDWEQAAQDAALGSALRSRAGPGTAGATLVLRRAEPLTCSAASARGGHVPGPAMRWSRSAPAYALSLGY
jgi:hypothetical protein